MHCNIMHCNLSGNNIDDVGAQVLAESLEYMHCANTRGTYWYFSYGHGQI